jgi:hypothetical protein
VHLEADTDKQSPEDAVLKVTVAILGALLVITTAVVTVVTLTVARSEKSTVPPIASTSLTSTAAILDDFARPDGTSLGAPSKGPAWSDIGGLWGIEDQQARVLKRAGDVPTVALNGSSSGNGTAEVTLSVIANEAGLIFRFQDLSNYWRFVAVPQVSTYVLSKVVNGQLTVVGTAGLAAADDGTTIAASYDGPKITIIVDGVPRETFTDASLQGATGVGLIATADVDLKARFDDFLVSSH